MGSFSGPADDWREADLGPHRVRLRARGGNPDPPRCPGEPECQSRDFDRRDWGRLRELPHLLRQDEYSIRLGENPSRLIDQPRDRRLDAADPRRRRGIASGLAIVSGIVGFLSASRLAGWM